MGFWCMSCGLFPNDRLVGKVGWWAVSIDTTPLVLVLYASWNDD